MKTIDGWKFDYVTIWCQRELVPEVLDIANKPPYNGQYQVDDSDFDFHSGGEFDVEQDKTMRGEMTLHFTEPEHTREFINDLSIMRIKRQTSQTDALARDRELWGSIYIPGFDPEAEPVR